MTDDIYKAAGIIIRDRKLLVERSQGKTMFIAPGGSIEPGETPKQACVRELKEEFDIDVDESDLEPFGEFQAPAAEQEHRTVFMTVFTVKKFAGEPRPSSEVEEIAWISADNTQGLMIGSIFEHQVIPRLKEKGLID
jgi:8-oxo-dGTP pyrophosphatase MutT (NUDIX family)